MSYIRRSVPEIGVELAANAIGRDWINEGDFFGRSETGTGFSGFALRLLGLTAGLRDGLEVNVLGFLRFGLLAAALSFL